MSDDGLMDQSEQLDGDELGEEVGDDYVPALRDYPPDEAQGAEDPNLYTDDDVAVRTMREEDEVDLELGRELDALLDGDEDDDDAAGDLDRDLAAADDGGVDLVLPDDEDTMVDDEAAALGELGVLDQGDPVPPEVAAVHVVDEPDLL